MNVIAWLGSHFIGLFQAGGQQFMGLASGIVPTLVVLLTATYATIRLIGEERVTRGVQRASKYLVTRYTIMPILALLSLTNPMAYTYGRFLTEKQKPAFYDSAVSFCHPVTSFFPYANAGELFVWLGIADGIQKLGLSIGPLAARYFLVGIVVIFIRGVVTEQITKWLANRMERKTSAEQGIGQVVGN
ncbi:PTS sorbitol transporter subunit IIC [Alicyclobacillaceae bacterium I2511]|nr:PTS sorbitol transporter subunit IIC [Alicyclobacillaceae bacterium I2511]